MASQDRSRETVNAILEATARLLEEQGLSTISTNLIANRAGVSIGSLYQFFSSREDIFKALMNAHRAQVHERAHAILAPWHQGRVTASEVLPLLLVELIQMHRERPVLTQALSARLAHLDSRMDRRGEKGELMELVDRLSKDLSGDHQSARAKAWVAAELTAHLAHLLSHEPPGGVSTDDILVVHREMIAHLLG